MRISDWSSDVCSSDLGRPAAPRLCRTDRLSLLKAPIPSRFRLTRTMQTFQKIPLLRRHRWLAGLALGALALPSAAQAETLQGALAKAYENNPTLSAARAGQRANDAKDRKSTRL